MLESSDADWLFNGLALLAAAPQLRDKQLLMGTDWTWHYHGSACVDINAVYDQLQVRLNNSSNSSAGAGSSSSNTTSASSSSSSTTSSSSSNNNTPGLPPMAEQLGAQLLLLYLFNGGDYLPGIRAFRLEDVFQLWESGQAGDSNIGILPFPAQLPLVTVEVPPAGDHAIVPEAAAASASRAHRRVEIHRDAVMQLLRARFSSIAAVREEGAVFPEKEIEAQLKRCEYMMQLLYESVMEGKSDVREKYLEYGWERGDDQQLQWSR